MHKPESVQENETHEILLDFEKRTDHLISARRPNLELINKKKKKKDNLPSSGPQSENRRKRKERRILGPYQRNKKAVKYEVDDTINCCRCVSNAPQRIEKRISVCWYSSLTVSVSVCIPLSLSLSLYIYIYIERERERRN